jgi:exonuclease SbcC
MILNRMTLHNYKRFKDEDINFTNGITGIVGNNGVGKSSIVDAVFFALFGVSGGIPSDFIVSSFADGEKCEVILDFSIGSESFCLQRTFKKGKTVVHDAALKCKGEIRASGVSQVEAEVRRILGMGPVDFRNTVYAAQKDLMTLLDLTPGKRKEWFLRALGIDYLNTGSQKILKEQADAKIEAATLLAGELAALSRQDPAELDQTRQDLDALRLKVQAMQAEEKQQQEKRAEVFAESQEYQLRNVRHGQMVDKAEHLRNEIGILNGRVKALTEQMGSLTVNEQDLQQLEETVAEIPKAREDIETYRTKKTNLDQLSAEQKSAVREETNLQVRINKIKAQLETLDKGEEELGELFDKIRTTLGLDRDCRDVENAAAEYAAYVSEKISVTNARIQALEAARDKIKVNLETVRRAGPEGTCPICFQRLGDHFADVEKEYITRLAETKVEGDDLDQVLDKALKESMKVPSLGVEFSRIKQIRQALGYRENLETECRDLRSTLDDLDHHLQGINIGIEEIAYKEEDHLACKQRLVELEAAQKKYSDLMKRSAQQAGVKAQIAELNSQVTKNTTALTEIKDAIDKDPINLADGPRLTHEVEKLDIILKSISQDLATSTERERTLTQKVADLELAAARIGTVEQQLTDLRDEIEILKLTRAAIADYVIYIMQVVRARIESEVSSIISEITGGKYDQVLIDEDFNLLVRENDREYTVDRFSGGEQDDIAVALRIALSRYLAELHNVHESTLLIFDEIFGSQDEERRANLLTALRSQESRFPQILLISHIAEIQGEFENTLLVQGNGPVSTVKAGA